ncbi:tRNA lysidine(34) synthetase TilS [Mitsuaria sp. GD03876]|uniref:tRNA lysidine(34) synthetase TilS n=1 Tax=Mitsuaria sp. GD03876 TaxID=2975399 RepID=UPI00244C5147|nr:tRNA lysidine(34) synthetase TilS [Mitsuaria sp. GD03876]MDH0866293.1 tRNA lysidine(34) synthetase TilS [Mitsuaria sp. GD03876]
MIAVAASGGRDSTALLHATAVAAQSLGLRVVALHIHHGLSPQADAWLAHLREQVEVWRGQGLPVTLAHERLRGAPAAGDSVEAWARAGRHEALQRLTLAADADLLLLAHHRRDQAETFLLQALRGAGMAGLAAMPRAQWRDGVCWARPWLDHPREAIEAYVAAHGLRFVDDDSNADARYARNRLRLTAWPALTAQSAGVEAALAQSAQWAQQAADLQREIADEDLGRWADADGLAQAMLSTVSPARASNALRAWIRRETGRAAPASLIRRLLDEVPASASGRWPCGDVELHLYRGRLTARAAASPRLASPTGATHRPTFVDLARIGRHAFPDWGGAIDVEPVTTGGVALSALSNVELRPREGGEQFQAHPKGLPRALKKCWQTAGIPAVQREGPLIHVDGRLLFVPGLGLDARWWAPVDEPQMTLRWRPDACGSRMGRDVAGKGES